MNYDRFLNELGRSRIPSPLRQLYAVSLAARKEGDPLISLASGIPCPDTFPVTTITFRLRNGETVTLNEARTIECLQYGESPGIADLMEWIEKLLVKYHNPPLFHSNPVTHDGSRTKFMLTNGCQDAISKLFANLVSKGDTILIEESVYAGCLAALKPYNVKFASVKSKEGGMDVDDLERVLSRWSPKDATDKDSDIPKLMYIVPTGGNPTGQNLRQERKQRIYSLAQKYDFLIMEDDPYFFHNFETTSTPSFLSMDTDGRVLRLDSFSKIISAGMRLGYVSGPEAIVNVLLYHMQSSDFHGNHLAQMMVLGLLENWGLDGFQKHVETACGIYKQRRDMCVRVAEKHLKDLADWSLPSGGFFLWIKLRDIRDTKSFLQRRVFDKGVVCAPGWGFQTVCGAMSSHIRISFSLVTEDQMDMALCRLAEAIREELDQNTDTKHN